MKKVLYLIFILVIASGCSKKENLIGSWTLINLVNEKSESITPDYICTLTILPNGEFAESLDKENSTVPPTIVRGKWEYKDNVLVLNIESPYEGVMNDTIIKVNRNKLVLRSQNVEVTYKRE